MISDVIRATRYPCQLSERCSRTVAIAACRSRGTGSDVVHHAQAFSCLQICLVPDHFALIQTEDVCIDALFQCLTITQDVMIGVQVAYKVSIKVGRSGSL
jgi:hypothetical protein